MIGNAFVWYPHGSNRATNAPYLVSHNRGSTNVLVNQQSNGGSWRLIASGAEFAKGTNGFVRLSNNAGPSVVLADAVRFVYVEAQDFPTDAAVPQWWRDFFFGGAVDVTLDPDGDNYPTAQEYVLGTSPVDSSSRLAFWNESLGSNTTTVTFWPLHSNRSYQLQSRSDLTGGTWQSLASSPTPTAPDGRGRFDIGLSNASQSYFRLKAQMTTQHNQSQISRV